MRRSILSFLVEPLCPPDQMALAAVPLIDEHPLTDLVEQFEASRGFEPAGGYGGLVFEFFNFGPLADYFHSKERISVLACDCGEIGCWPLRCRVQIQGDDTIWCQFFQPHRAGRDYSDFGPFKFDSEQYMTAISLLQQQLSRRSSR